MNPAALRHKLVFQLKTIPASRSNSGAPQDAWTDDFEEYGALEPVGTRLFPIAQRRWSEATVRFRIRHLPGRDINPALYRIVVVIDTRTSPAATSTWTISRPMQVDGRPWEVTIEAYEAK